MGHVDHGKTSLLDYIRRENVVAGEAGGITQHIGAYNIKTPDGRQITFLDTPGHEAFTAMRARGAQVTDIVIIVVAADDSVMPQTVEAINHARAASVPMIVAINKVDKPTANVDKVMQQLTEHNVIVEQYGGDVPSVSVSALNGTGMDDLLEVVGLQADLLELKANPNRKAQGTVIESRLDKGKGVVSTVLVQNGTLKVGDIFVAGIHAGRVRALFDERENRIDHIRPGYPTVMLGLAGQPDVGDRLVVMDDEREAREIAQRRQQIHREQSLRQRKHITLDEIGRRLALGDFKELNLIVKADVGGSAEAVCDSLLKLSTPEVALNIIHDGVGAITEGDVMLASASDAIIIGFNVRPSASARQVAEREEIDIRTYSVIYKIIEDVKSALEGLLSPEETERTLGTVEVRETFKVPKVGTIAGCYVIEGKINRNNRMRVIRDGVVIYETTLASLKRFKDDVREVATGYECGIGLVNYDDVKVGDQYEAFEIVESKRTLDF
jgi:translation initiation factor IF-2